MSTLKPKRRWLPRFSLRTLLIVVVVYGVLWLLTLKIGGPMLAKHYAHHYENGFFKIRQRGADLRVEYPDQNDSGGYIGNAFALAPFILVWQWERGENTSGLMDHPEGLRDFHAWILFSTFPLVEHRSPKLWFVPY